MPQTSEGGASRVAIVEFLSTSKILTKLSREAEAATAPEGCAATETTPRECPVLGEGQMGSSASGRQRRTVSSRDPVSSSEGRFSVAGTHAHAQIESSCALSRDFSPESFMEGVIRGRADGE